MNSAILQNSDPTEAALKENISNRPPSLGATHIDESEYSSTTNIDLIRERQRHLGNGILFYDDPIHIVRGEGVWLFDQAGRAYLDCYNNVPCVGHANPSVVDAMAKQAAKVNVHSRYLHRSAIEYAKKLSALLPGDLNICMFVCTGTEANELAMRIARAVTGHNGGIVMEYSYHGNSTLISEMSTFDSQADQRPDHVVAIEPPNTFRGPFRLGEADLGRKYADLLDEAIAKLDARGQGTAAFMCDAIFDSQGGLEAPPDYFRHAYEKVRAAGGLCIADEVQAGLGRTGRMWGFEHYEVVPDIVTIGKPLGNGYPMAAVITSPEIAKKFAASNIYFNTFAGTPVSAEVGAAVLETIIKDELVENARVTGQYLRDGLIDLAKEHPSIGNVRGLGLYQAIEFIRDQTTLEPDADLARRLPDVLKAEGILVGLSGRYGNVIKIRPPLVFAKEHADQLLAALRRALHK